MRRIDKKLNMMKVNLLAESRYFEYKGLIKEGDEEQISGDDYFSKYNTTMQEQKEICWNMVQHFNGVDRAIAENEKMMKDKIMRAKEAEAAGNSEEANDYMESIKLYQFRIQYINNNRDMLSTPENPFFNK